MPAAALNHTLNNDGFKQAIADHDRLAEAFLPGIWIGAEPTFTLGISQSREWLSDALGGDKIHHAKRMMQALSARHNHAVVLRTLGRQYDREPRPRWSFGLYRRRDGLGIWQGPPDPLDGPRAEATAGAASALWLALRAQLLAQGLHPALFKVEAGLPLRILCRADGPAADLDPRQRPELGRAPLHSRPIPRQGLNDEPATAGEQLFCIGIDDEEAGVVCIELPQFARIAEFLSFLQHLEAACAAAGTRQLVIRGYPPPVDHSVGWTTITPDPAVIEVNQAPYPSLARFHAASEEIHAVAASVGLTPTRLHYNGAVSDSGGGGQITFGGRTPAESPFFREPALLPDLIVYLNNHPALSYLFATDYLGSCSQSPRPDEGIQESLDELETALELFQTGAGASPEHIWRSFAPFMADPSGNAHRSELNIEKLWNPGLPGRGCLGLVEFRALRMSADAAQATAIAALLRAILVMLARRRHRGRLIHWGRALHDRFALPWFLRRDLRSVLDELAQHGVPLAPALVTALLDATGTQVWRREFANCVIEIEKAVEFWPLVGDVASQESGGSRLVDSSTRRLQISLHCKDDSLNLDEWRLRIQGWRMPLQTLGSESGPLCLLGIRYREFKPWTGLHPGLEAQNPLRFHLSHPRLQQVLQAELHNWQPQGLPYPDLPSDLAQAQARREERLVTAILDATQAQVTAPEAPLHGEFCVDLRRLADPLANRPTD